MLRLIIALVLITSCAGTKSSGGKHRYRYEPEFDYTVEDLKELAPAVVLMEKRDPRAGSLDKLFDPRLPDLKRIGIVVFETQIQPTRTGLSDNDLIYVSEQGKQLLTEKFLTLWEEEGALMAPDLEYVSSQTIKSSRTISKYGLEVPDYIKADRSGIENDDIQWLPAGKKTPLYTVMNPRGMRDLSFMLVPAAELMGGPKWSEQNKIFVNDICKELGLDAVVVVMSQVNWTAARKDKFTNENYPEQMNLTIKATTLVPFENYHQRLKATNVSDLPAINVAYRYHEGKISIPVRISIPESERTFAEIEGRILNPMMKTYRDLSLMVIDQIATELRKTF